MKNRTMYLVTSEYAMEFENGSSTKLFAYYDAAKAYFYSAVSENEQNDHLVGREDTVINRDVSGLYLDEYEIYKDGHYCEDHFSIRIEEVKVEDEYGVNEFDNSTDASENYKKANKILSNVDVTTVAKACSAISTLISNMNIGADYDMLLSEINEKVADILNIGRALKTYGKKKKCPKCGKQLYLSDLPQYDYVCPWCDENF